VLMVGAEYDPFFDDSIVWKDVGAPRLGKEGKKSVRFPKCSCSSDR